MKDLESNLDPLGCQSQAHDYNDEKECGKTRATQTSDSA